jgi:hypothetical protein
MMAGAHLIRGKARSTKFEDGTAKKDLLGKQPKYEKSGDHSGRPSNKYYLAI